MARETMAQMMAGVERDATPRPRLIANNTVEYRRYGERVIRLHHTDILTISADGERYTVNSGGWQTVTTKDRLNRYLPSGVRIWSERGLWRIGRHLRDGSVSIPFIDGLVIGRNGEIPHYETTGAAINGGIHAAQTAKAIAKFVNRLDVTHLPRPEAGDCFYCSMFDRIESSPQRGQPGDGTGSKSRDPSHLREHIREGYMHGALLVNAMRWAGWTDHRIALTYQDSERRRAGDSWGVKRTLRRFLRSQLGLPT